MQDSRFDATSDPGAASSSAGPSKQPRSRPFLGINFQCCHAYGRIYRNDEQTAYVGQCPRCRARVRVPIGKGGTGSRFFNAG